jgi:hypothetical protein
MISMAANFKLFMISLGMSSEVKFRLIQPNLQRFNTIKMHTVILQRISNSPIKAPIIKKNWAQADNLRANLMLKDKETANSHCLIIKLGTYEMMIPIIIMLNYKRDKSVIKTDRRAFKIITIIKK